LHVSLADVAKSFSESPEFVHSFDAMSDSTYVSHLCNDVLHRPEDTPGAQYWVGVLASGVGRGTLALNFADSPEFRSKILSVEGDKSDAESYRLYQTALDRAPDDAGISSGPRRSGVAQRRSRWHRPSSASFTRTRSVEQRIMMGLHIGPAL
jgi:hypothetical protein